MNSQFDTRMREASSLKHAFIGVALLFFASNSPTIASAASYGCYIQGVTSKSGHLEVSFDRPLHIFVERDSRKVSYWVGPARSKGAHGALASTLEVLAGDRDTILLPTFVCRFQMALSNAGDGLEVESSDTQSRIENLRRFFVGAS